MTPDSSKPHRRPRFTAVLAVLALVAASCGGSDSPDDTISETTPGTDGPTGHSSRPEAFWAIDSLSYDLVLVDTESGRVLTRRLGWGPPILDGQEPEGGQQALVEVASGGGLVWVADCCEPAVGSVFGVEPGSVTPVPQSSVVVNGLGPTVSLDGALLALQVLDSGVAILDADTGAQLVGPDVVKNALLIPANAVGFVSPLTWIDDSTLAIGASDAGTTTVTFVSFENPSSPSPVGPTITVEGTIVDAATRGDGALVSAVYAADTTDVSGRVHDVVSGEEKAVFDLPDGTDSIDYDPTGTFLLVSTADGVVSWIGGGESVEIARSLYGARWAGKAALPTDPTGDLSLDTIQRDQFGAVGIDPVGGCSFYRNGVTGDAVFFSGADGALIVVDGEPVRFESEESNELGPFTGVAYSAAYGNVSDPVQSGTESTERAATLEVTGNDGAGEITVDGIIWCGV